MKAWTANAPEAHLSVRRCLGHPWLGLPLSVELARALPVLLALFRRYLGGLLQLRLFHLDNEGVRVFVGEYAWDGREGEWADSISAPLAGRKRRMFPGIKQG